MLSRNKSFRILQMAGTKYTRKKLKELRQVRNVKKMLRALGYMPRLELLAAWEAFKQTHFGLSYRTVDQVVEHMDFMCQLERVGDYEPEYPDW